MPGLSLFESFRKKALTNRFILDKLTIQFIRDKPKGGILMDNVELGEVQLRFAELVWHYAPLPSGELVKICQRELNWKKPTTYTVLRKLCEKGLFKNENGLVSVVMTQEQFYAARSEQFVEDAFDGSLPAFITAFTSRKKLSAAEVDEIQRMIDTFRKEG